MHINHEVNFLSFFNYNNLNLRNTDTHHLRLHDCVCVCAGMSDCECVGVCVDVGVHKEFGRGFKVLREETNVPSKLCARTQVSAHKKTWSAHKFFKMFWHMYHTCRSICR